MGLFSKFKENIHHGGVKINVQAPISAAENSVVPVIITITATEQQTINKVWARLQLRVTDRRNMGGMNIGTNNGMNNYNNENYTETLAEAQNNETLTIAANETKTVNLNIVIPANAGQHRMSDQVGGALGSAMRTLGNLANSEQYQYVIEGKADVEGVALDPAQTVDIQIVPSNGAPAAPTAPTPPATPPAVPPVEPAQ